MIEKLSDMLSCISADDYDDWIKVGMVLKKEGHSLDEWTDWSRSSAKYKDGDCEKKWDSFSLNDSRGVGVGTLVELAKEYGYRPHYNSKDSKGGVVLDWDDEIDDMSSPVEIASEKPLEPHEQLIRYLDTLFKDDDMVSYVVGVYDDGNGRYFPQKGVCQRKSKIVRDLKHYAELDEYKDTPITYALGDYKPEVGAWIRFNPMDGSGEVKNDNVVAFRYALVECDTIPKDEQEQLYRKHRLPIACMVDSGGKSVHAIVHIDAEDYEEYRERVSFLYSYLKNNDVLIDKANKNPSRLSRMPGVMRNGNVQRLMGTNIGCRSWQEWYSLVNDIQDDLPEFQTIGVADNEYITKELAPAIIDGVLRQGHKMLIAGPSKAGKSFLLMQLAVAIATGGKWIDHFECKEGKVVYINFEIDSNSCYNRIVAILVALGYEPDKVKQQLAENLLIMNMRGKSEEIKELTPKLVKRLKKYQPNAVIIDPIYKIIMGDENNASDMGKFCNEFDKLCNETGASVILCHHHSKGAQGNKKSMDRASGSGVFARDPDALVDVIPLDLSKELRSSLQDDGSFPFRMEFSLREFAYHEPVDLWFEFPLHKADKSGELADAPAEGSAEANLQKSSKRQTAEERKQRLDDAYDSLNDFEDGESITVSRLANYSGMSYHTMKRAIDENTDRYSILTKGVVVRNE